MSADNQSVVRDVLLVSEANLACMFEGCGKMFIMSDRGFNVHILVQMNSFKTNMAISALDANRCFDIGLESSTRNK
jgi:hypothetical protein